MELIKEYVYSISEENRNNIGVPTYITPWRDHEESQGQIHGASENTDEIASDRDLQGHNEAGSGSRPSGTTTKRGADLRPARPRRSEEQIAVGDTNGEARSGSQPARLQRGPRANRGLTRPAADHAQPDHKLFEYKVGQEATLQWCQGTVVKLLKENDCFFIVEVGRNKEFLSDGDQKKSWEKLLRTKWNPEKPGDGAWRQDLRHKLLK